MPPLTVRRILLVSLDNLGDLVFASALAPPLRARFPEARITLLCKRYTADIAALVPDIGEMVMNREYIRAHSAEKYLIYHSTQKPPCGQLIVVDDGYDLFLTMMLYPTFAWDEPAYHLDGDPEGRTFAEILVDVVAAEVIEPWGGGKWHLEVFRSTAAEPEDWNGEM